MASTFAVTRNHLIFGICLPLALLLGYLLADAQDPTTLLVVGAALMVLSVPLVMRWYHPLLILCWNMNAQPALPGSPYLWAIMAFIACLCAVINRAMNAENRLSPVMELTVPLLAFLGVVGFTIVLTGGIGLGALRSGSLGGKSYFYIIAAVAGFVALSSRAIPRERALFYLALFFLPGLLAVSSRIAGLIGPAANFVYALFPPDYDSSATTVGEMASLGQERLRGVTTAATMFFFWLLARVGVGGLFDWKKPWRMLAFGLIIFSAGFGGYRSVAISMGLTFGILFYMERLWRTKTIVIIGVIAVLGGALLINFSDKLPMTVQRTLSFLPLELDYAVRANAEDSSEWRLQIWREAWEKEVPKYVFLGKGYQINPDDLYMSTFSLYYGHWRNWEWAYISGDYHNGPLSVLIPFGVFGLAAFLWFLFAGGRFLLRMYRNSPAELRGINALLLACFLARAIFFLVIYGAVAYDLCIFTGLLGFSVALNVPQRSAEAAAPAPELEASPQV